MMDAIKLRRVYSLFIDNDNVTTKELLECGLTSKNIKALVDSGNIRRLKRGVYTVDGSAFANFSCNRLKSINSEQAIALLERAEYFEPDNVKVKLKLLPLYIRNYSFDEAYTIIDYFLRNGDNKYGERDINTILYLYGFVCDLPEKYKYKVKGMTINPLLPLIDDSKYSKSYDEQIILRELIYNLDFSDALDYLNSELDCTNNDYLTAIRNLLEIVSIKSLNIKNQLYNLIINNNYMEALEFMKQNIPYFRSDEYLTILLEDAIKVESGVIVEKTGEDSIDFESAIMNHDYEVALQLLPSLNDGNYNRAYLIKFLLADKICSKNEMLRFSEALEKLNDKNSHFSMQLNNLKIRLASCVCSQVVDSLSESSLDLASGYVSTYLKDVERENLLPYVVDLMKLSLLDGDYEDVLDTILEIGNDSFVFDAANYVQDFYQSIYAGNTDKASIYLDILRNSSQCGGIVIDVSEMEEILNDGNSDENNVSSSIEDILGEIMLGNNLVVLAPMSDEDIQANLSVAQLFKNIKTDILTDEDGNRRLALRYYDRDIPIEDNREIFNSAYDKLNNWEYKGALKLFQSVLPKIEYPSSTLYSKIGFCYEQTTYDGDYSKAIDYYMLAKSYATTNEEYDLACKDLKRLEKKSSYSGRVITSNPSFKVYEK